MVLRRGTSFEFLPRPFLVRVLTGFLLLLVAVTPAQATLLPPGFFDMMATPAQGPAAVEADRLSYDGQHDVISAEGNVVLSYQGYVIKADRVTYNQQTSELHAEGHVVMRDPAGDSFAMDSIAVTGGMKDAFLESLTLTTSDGAVVTVGDAHYSAELATVLTDASFSPCGLCVDTQGRKIGWKVKAARMIYDRDHASVTLEQPSLELLGIPVAWLPWFWVPDPTQPRATGLRMPSVNYDAPRGVILSVPYFIPATDDVDIILTPTLLSRQGGLMRAGVKWRLPQYGEIDVAASGLYQLDKSAFAGTAGYRDWRGAIQTSGHFTPTKDWTVGWSYSAFTDNDYLYDYNSTDIDTSINQVYGTYLTTDTWLDARLQHFNRIGQFASDAAAQADDAQQGEALPKVEFDHVQDLAPGWGRLHVSGEWLGVERDADQNLSASYPFSPATTYVPGYAGDKQHLELEGAWENQYILPGGVTASPYLGMRLDATNYDSTSSAPLNPGTQLLLTPTPIAAVDFRWPLIAKNGLDSHLLEPVAQLVYRGSSTTLVGVTNDDAQSFVFDESNLFTYNHFSGIDRQDTGLRANVGGHYLGNFADGSWIDFIAGESFQLLGTNALGITDPTLVGTDSGLGSTASYLVAAAHAGLSNGISFGAKMQVDPASPRITRAGLGVNYANANRFSTGVSYIYIAPDPSLGIITDQHEIGGTVSVPVADYWTVNGGITYNVASMAWTAANAGVTYDDGYLTFGGTASATPTSYALGVTFNLKGPDGVSAF